MLTVDKKNNANCYAVVDLGSNSFHMLIAKAVAGDLQTIGRIKRKVRLAAGLDEGNQLSVEAMQRGWECLSLFAERLQDIPAENITIVATATLRLAVNAEQFIEKAELLLGHKLRVISGEEEAKTIYKGVAHTSSNSGKQLVIDIGGASTEVVIGDGFKPILYESLNIGCVTYFEKYFSDGLLNQNNFDAAIAAAKEVISDVSDEFKTLGWLTVSGASGTVQAIQEIMIAQRQDELTLEKLKAIKSQAQLYQTIETLKLPGLAQERKLVFASGLSILIALFECLEIEFMELAGGALREGVLYSMIPELHNSDIRERTINSFISRYHIDSTQSKRVADIAHTLANHIKDEWQFSKEDLSLLDCAAKLHETGLLIGYKKYGLHGSYIMANTEMPGFTKAQKSKLVYLVKYHKDDIDTSNTESSDNSQYKTQKLLHILRLAVILSMRRQDDVLPELKLLVSGNTLSIVIPHIWYSQHPLMQAELEAEAECIAKVGQTFHVAVN